MFFGMGQAPYMPQVCRDFLILAALAVISLHRAQAQSIITPVTQPTESGIETLVTPYLWLPWTSVDVRPSNRRIPNASTEIDPGQLISHLTWVPFMGTVEFRDGQFGLAIDYLHAPLKSGVTTRNILFNGATAGLVIDSGSAMVLYRPVAAPDQYLDIGAGVRAWGSPARLT